MGDDTFTLFLRLSAWRREEDASQYCIHIQPDEMVPETTTPEYALFSKILQNVQACSERDNGWQDEAVYGGLIAIQDIPRLGCLIPDSDFFGTLFKAMEKTQPFRVRKAAYDVILVAREGWLRSAELRQTLEDLDFPRQMHSVVIEIGRLGYHISFLNMMETLSYDGDWHSYIRGAMDILLPFRHEAPRQVLRIISPIGNLPVQGYENSSNPPPFDRFLEKVVEDEWKGIPGRSVTDLTANHLKPLAEITKQFKGQLFTETDRRAVLAVVVGVIPALERRRDDGYKGPGEDVRHIVDDLLEVLRVPVQSDQPSVHWLGG